MKSFGLIIDNNSKIVNSFVIFGLETHLMILRDKYIICYFKSHIYVYIYIHIISRRDITHGELAFFSQTFE